MIPGKNLLYTIQSVPSKTVLGEGAAKAAAQEYEHHQHNRLLLRVGLYQFHSTPLSSGSKTGSSLSLMPAAWPHFQGGGTKEEEPRRRWRWRKAHFFFLWWSLRTQNNAEMPNTEECALKRVVWLPGGFNEREPASQPASTPRGGRVVDGGAGPNI